MRLFDSLCELVIRVLDFTVGFHPNKPITSSSLQIPISDTAIKPRPGYSDEICNGPYNRREWCDGKSIYTDYEVISNTPQGVVRNYYLEVENRVICPDGYCFNGTLVNGTYPGPTLFANWGDTLNITVHNVVENCNGTSIHFHGLRQWNTFYSDGVPGVTQCPIKPGDSMTYTWHANQYGSSWYHSHFSLQYANGVLGPLVLYGPTSANYDIDAGPLLITDWFHADAFSLFGEEIGPDGPPTPDSLLINGIGNYTTVSSEGIVSLGCAPGIDENCVGASFIYNYTVVAGKRYKFRIVNTSAITHLTFSIDNHTLEVVSTDFVPIEHYKVSNLTVAIGQRYEVIVEANADTSVTKDFWIKMRDCSNVCAGDPYPSGSKPTLQECRQGILSYNKVAGIPTLSAPNPLNTSCPDAPLASMKPVVKRTVTGIPKELSSVNKIPGFQVQRGANDSLSFYKYWSISDFTFRVNWSDPTTKNILEYPWYSTWQPQNYEPIYLNGTDDDWVAFLIEGEWAGSDNEYALPVPHPIHLHGHDYVILDQSDKAFNSSATYVLDMNNPPRRDVAMLPRSGYLVLAFRLDNPGPWIMHCHIAFHASAGLALQFIERPADIKSKIMTKGIEAQFYRQCDAWTTYYNADQCLYQGRQARQDDSGI